MIKSPEERLKEIEDKACYAWMRANVPAGAEEYRELPATSKRKYILLAMSEESLVKYAQSLERELQGARRDYQSMEVLMKRRNETITQLQCNISSMRKGSIRG